jgi:hypothetical protein
MWLLHRMLVGMSCDTKMELTHQANTSTVTSRKELIMEPRFIIIRPKTHREIGHGVFSRVYKLNKTQVIKVFKDLDCLEMAKEEAGSHKQDGLAIDEIVRVKLFDRLSQFDPPRKIPYLCWGCIKRYIPYAIDRNIYEEYYRDIIRERNRGLHDLHWHNVRLDYDGKAVIIDTGWIESHPWEKP